MTRIRRSMVLVLMASLPGCGEVAPPSAKVDDLPAFLRPLAEADKVTLYSIDGSMKAPGEDRPKAAQEFRGYPVLGSVEISPVERRAEMILALKRGTEDLDHGFARCFWPRHALRAEKDGKSVDYVICFECSWIKVFGDGGVQDIVTKKGAQDLLNRHLKAAGAPIVP